ncbi:MAG: hypothetical protein ABI607_00520 [Betaproteobacteria bacterium]
MTVIAAVVIVALGIFIWASDRITMEGQRTIYTVSCEQGAWDGLRCSGRVRASDRHRFRASRSRHEVVYWIAGSNTPSGKFIDCNITDRDRWVCAPRAGEPPTIAHELIDGRPVQQAGNSNVPFHAVSKWKWWALDLGVPIVSKADFSSTIDPHQQAAASGK